MTLNKMEVEAAARSMAREAQARAIMSDDLDGVLAALFPGDADFVKRNGNVSNELMRGAGEIADAVSAAAINWTTDSDDDSGVEQFLNKTLVRLLAVEALVSGKMALFPRMTESGALDMAVLSGYLHPVLSRDNALTVEALLQVLPVLDGDSVAFQVRRYSPGLLEVFPPVAEWQEFEKGQPDTYPQPHAAGRLPVAFIVVRRDARRYPSGLVAECGPAFLRYLKTAVNRNAVQEIAGWPERVVQSDKYLALQLGEVQPPPGVSREAILEQLRRVAPRQLKLLGTSDTYAVQDGVDPAPHMAAEMADKQALLDLLRSPDLSGGNLSGVALAERQTKARALISDLCDSVAWLATDAARLAAGLPGSNVPEDVQASVTPRWATDNAARVQQVGDLYSKAAIPKSVALQELQTAGFGSITDEMIQAAQDAEAADLMPDLGGDEDAG
ncbi:hypothetical protein ACFP81_06455 [Deinococcus lacus]|uniref:Phage portal protein n=1 Tax=Deinococcus lacus TaxID=392561 RepID=A0ABW1YDW5_9DEIO